MDPGDSGSLEGLCSIALEPQPLWALEEEDWEKPRSPPNLRWKSQCKRAQEMHRFSTAHTPFTDEQMGSPTTSRT